MAKFYFTYGSENHPFVGGWTVIHAEDEEIARNVFRAFHPSREAQIRDCCDVYTEDEFKRSKMASHGNHGVFCREVIIAERVLVDEAADDD